MIVTDVTKLRVKCSSTTVEACRESGIFEELEKELKASPTKGIGLAAPQIGRYVRACIIRIPEHKDSGGKTRQAVTLNMINPVIEKADRPARCQGEGCLSLPGRVVDTIRYQEITASWIDYDTNETRRAVFYEGLEAV